MPDPLISINCIGSRRLTRKATRAAGKRTIEVRIVPGLVEATEPPRKPDYI
ncbi:hypothetical protein NHJ13734_007385 [Beauveria thailandica]